MNGKKLSVFAIDDNPADLEILSRKLNKISGLNIDFYAFNSWKTAETELKRLSINIIFVDYLLGTDSGLDIIKNIRSSGDHRPIIMLTGQGSEKIAAEVTRAGANDYLIKDELTPDLLRVSIYRAIEGYKAQRDQSILKEQLLQAQKMETMGILAGGIAHDFNNMLSAVMGYIEMATMKVQGSDIEIDLKKAREACRQMAGIVQNLLSFSRKDILDQKPEDINQIIVQTENIIRYNLPKNVDLIISLPKKSSVVFCNSTKIQQVIQNLITNASEAMNGSGQIEVNCKEINIDNNFLLKHYMLSHGNYVCIEVFDHGSGINESTSSRIFEPFFTTKALGKKRGTGLGLALVWQIVRDHHGTVTFYSELNKGTTFKVYLPIYIRDIDRDFSKAKQSHIPKGTESILFVDDEVYIRNMVSEVLGNLGYTIYLASDGEMAIRTFNSIHKKLGCVILDVSMLRMDGKACIAHLKKINPKVPVIFASGHDLASIKDELPGMGAAGVIQKPYRLLDMAQRIRAVISG